MKSFFSVDGKLYIFMSRLWDIIQLNFCWVICSLPIITIGASTVAAFRITNRMVDNEEGYIFKPFFREFAANLKNGIPIGLIAMLGAYVVYLDFQLFEAVEQNPIIFLIFGLAAVCVFTASLLYAFPLSARYSNSFFNTLKNSARISTKFFARTIALILVLALEIVVMIFNNVTLLFALLIGPACLFYTTSGFAMYFFRRIEAENAGGEVECE